MGEWWKNNWDKLLALAIGGVIGYYSALRAVDSKISGLQTAVGNLRTELDTAITPQVSRIDGFDDQQKDHARRIETLESADLAVRIYQINLESKLKQTQADTLRELKEMVQSIQAQPRSN